METNSKFKIFLVDDNQVCINLYQRFLAKIGYQNISSFTKSSVFIEAINEEPDLIFLDYSLDERNGIELLDATKNRYPNTVIVLVSGQKDLLVAVNSLKRGALDYIVKDELTLDTMRLVVDRAVEIRAEWARQNRNGVWQKLVRTTSMASIIFFFQKLFVKN